MKYRVFFKDELTGDDLFDEDYDCHKEAPYEGDVVAGNNPNEDWEVVRHEPTGLYEANVTLRRIK